MNRNANSNRKWPTGSKRRRTGTRKLMSEAADFEKPADEETNSNEQIPNKLISDNLQITKGKRIRKISKNKKGKKKNERILSSKSKKSKSRRLQKPANSPPASTIVSIATSVKNPLKVSTSGKPKNPQKTEISIQTTQPPTQPG